MTVGLDIDAAAGKKTQQLARKMGGQMIFIKTDLTKDGEMEHAVPGGCQTRQHPIPRQYRRPPAYRLHRELPDGKI